MRSNERILAYAAALFLKACLLAARWAGSNRAQCVRRIAAMPEGDLVRENLLLREQVAELQARSSLMKKKLRELSGVRLRYSLAERLAVVWHMEIFKLPRRRVTEYLGVARSTYYRWLHRIDDPERNVKPPPNKTPAEIAALVWDVASRNAHWGRNKIAAQLKLLQLFIAASTVRNILHRPRPDTPSKAGAGSETGTAAQDGPDELTGDTPAASEEAAEEPRSIPAWYPNHVWSVDRTIVRRWGVFKLYVLVVIDHFSRKIVAVVPLEGGNAGWTVEALEAAFEEHGAPRHIISDKEKVFWKCEAYTELLERHGVKPRFGAVGKHGSIAVTERAIRTLKYEWLKRVPLLRSFDHVAGLCEPFAQFYNAWRPHSAIDGLTPDDRFFKRMIEPPAKDAKVIAVDIERWYWPETRTTGYRIRQAS